MNLTNSQLFIPRKQNLTGASGARTYPVIQPLGSQASGSTGYDPSTVNAQHLEDALRENFLAIQNWANKRAVSCSVRGSTVQTFPYNSQTTLNFDTKTWDYNSIASTGSQTLTVPGPGIYTVSAGVALTNLPGQSQVLLAMQPGTYPAQSGFVSGTTSLGWDMTFGGNLQQFKGGEQLSVSMYGIFGTTDSAGMILREFTLTKLFDRPSKVQ